MSLTIHTASGEMLAVAGHANFFLVRGDSAQIPEELRARGFGPDSARWYLRRWDDETSQEGLSALAIQPAATPSWCALKARYR